MEIAFRGVENLLKDFEKKLFDLIRDTLELGQNHPAVLVKIIQIVEREEKLDEILKAKLINQKLDPFDDINRKSFRRYKELFFHYLRDSISNRFEKCFSKCSDIAEILKEAQMLLDDLTVVLDEIVPCFPDRYKIFDFFFKEYHIRFNTQMLSYANNPELVKAKDIIDLVRWVRQEYEPQLGRLGISDPQPPLIETLEPLYQAYKEHIRVQSQYFQAMFYYFTETWTRVG